MQKYWVLLQCVLLYGFVSINWLKINFYDHWTQKIFSWTIIKYQWQFLIVERLMGKVWTTLDFCMYIKLIWEISSTEKASKWCGCGLYHATLVSFTLYQRECMLKRGGLVLMVLLWLSRFLESLGVNKLNNLGPIFGQSFSVGIVINSDSDIMYYLLKWCNFITIIILIINALSIRYPILQYEIRKKMKIFSFQISFDKHNSVLATGSGMLATKLHQDLQGGIRIKRSKNIYQIKLSMY